MQLHYHLYLGTRRAQPSWKASCTMYRGESEHRGQKLVLWFGCTQCDACPCCRWRARTRSTTVKVILHIIFIVAKGPVTLRNFLSNLSRNAVARQVAWITKYNMGCLANFFVARSIAQSRTQLYFSQWIAQCIIPPATYRSFSEGACAHFSFFISRSIAKQAAEEIAQCNRAVTPNLRNLQRYIFKHCETSCWENCAV